MGVRRPSLDTVVNLATLVTCMMIIGAYIQGRNTSVQGQSQLPTYKAGEQISGLNTIYFKNSHKTLLMAIRNDCHFCEDSLPFYKSLAQAIATDSGATRMVVITTDDKSASASHLAASGVHVNDIVPLTASAMLTLKIPGTPTLVLVNDKGVVDRAWVGKLTPAMETDVLARVTSHS